MSMNFLVTLCVTLSTFGQVGTATNASKNPPLVLQNVTVIDGTGAAERPNQTVVIVDGQILGIAPEVATLPPKAVVVDGTGKFLIPGLWDMHVHVATMDYLTLFIANGVTTIREMHAFSPDYILSLRKQTAEGKIVGPRIFCATSLVDGANPIWPGSLVAKDPQEGRAAVRTLKERKADFVKVYSKLTRETYLAIADEAKKQNMVFAGHVPESVSALEASKTGQRTMEHLYGVFLALSPKEEELRKTVVQTLTGADNTKLFRAMNESQTRALEHFDDERMKTLFAAFVANHTWQTPTLTVLRAMAHGSDPEYVNDPRQKYISPFVKARWNGGTAAGRKRFEPIYLKSSEIVGKMYSAGVPILAGTDTTNPFCFPGFSLHDELELLVKAGLTPMAALQATTKNAAECMKVDKEVGTITPGKSADLLLLDANPLSDIRNTKKIAAVIKNGKYLPKAELDAMLAKVEDSYKKPAATPGKSN